MRRSSESRHYWSESRPAEVAGPCVHHVKASKTAALACAALLLAALLPLAGLAPVLAAPGNIILCSRSAANVQGNGDSYSPRLSPDGRYVVFESYASNLVNGDGNGFQDIFWKDLQTGEVRRCSTDKDGNEADGFSEDPVISEGQRYVAFSSTATNLVSGDGNGLQDIFRKDLWTGEVALCSVDSTSNPSNGSSYHPAISADGRYVAFLSESDDLVPGDTNGKTDVFRKDLWTGEVALCSTTATGAQANDSSEVPSMSADGRYVAFGSGATNLVTPDNNGNYDVFRKDMTTGAVLLCSPGTGGGADGESFLPAVSADGRFVAFESLATNLVSGDTNGVQDIFIYDALSGSLERCSATAGGVQANGTSAQPAVSGDGRFVVFASEADNLVPGDANGKSDVFRKDMYSGAVACASTDPAGAIKAGWSGVPAVSADGGYVAFASAASELVPGDTGAYIDVFRKELAVPCEFYFAEGYTGEGFQEYLCLGQPADAPLDVTVTFLFAGGATDVKHYQVPPRSRLTVDVNGTVGAGREVSMKCEAHSPFVAERPMYFDYTGAGENWTGGHDAVGAARTSTAWYFAEGYTGPGFDEWVCVLNPGDTAAGLTFRFQTQEVGEKVVPGLDVPARSRQTFKVNDLLGGEVFSTSLKLESTLPVVAERPMYFRYSGLWQHAWTGGHCVVGAPSLATQYYFAEGYTGADFEEWLCIQNPGTVPIEVDATFMLEGGAPMNRKYPVPGGKRETVYVPDVVGLDRNVSIYLSCARPFLAERPMYFDYMGTGTWGWTGGHCVIGATASAQEWFFAEGYTGDGFEMWLCIQNPGDSGAEVNITYLPEGGTPIEKDDFLVPANSRFTVPVNADAGKGLSISTLIASDQPIIVERPMYFSYGRWGWTGGHDVLGFTL